MSENEREHLTRVNNFFCGLHYIVGLADCAEEALKAWENDNIPQEASGSGTQRLVKPFTTGGPNNVAAILCFMLT